MAEGTGNRLKLTPGEAILRGRIGAYVLHSTHDSRKITANAHQAFLRKFEDEVDPEKELSPDERRRRAEHARKAYFLQLALRSAQLRGRRKNSSKETEAHGGR